MSYTLQEYCQLPLDARPTVRYMGMVVAWVSLDTGYHLEERYMIKCHKPTGTEIVYGGLLPDRLVFTNGEV